MVLRHIGRSNVVLSSQVADALEQCLVRELVAQGTQQWSNLKNRQMLWTERMALYMSSLALYNLTLALYKSSQAFCNSSLVLYTSSLALTMRGN